MQSDIAKELYLNIFPDFKIFVFILEQFKKGDFSFNLKKDMIWIEQFLLRTIFQLFTTKSIQFTHIFRHSEDSLLFTQ